MAGPAAAPRRRPGRLLLAALVAVSALGALGVAGALAISRTATGRELALEWTLARLEPAIGRARVGSVGNGGLLGGAVLLDVRVDDAQGRPFLRADSVRARYSLVELLGRGRSLADLRLYSPVLVLDVAARDEAPAGAVGASPAPELGERPPPESPPARAGEAAAPAPAWAIRGAEIHDGAVVLRDAAGERRRVEGVDARLRRVEVRADGRVVAEVADASLSYLLASGARAVDVRRARGVLGADADGFRLEAERFALPGSRGSGSVVVERGAGGVRTALEIAFSELALADAAWLDERLEGGVARGDVSVSLASDADGVDARADFRGVRLDLGDAGAVELEGGADFGVVGVRFRDLGIRARGLAAAEADRWLASGPDASWTLAGLWPAPTELSGALVVDGAPARLALEGDATLTEASSGAVVARVVGRGTRLAAGGMEGVSVRASALDYRLLRALVPSIRWTGRGSATLEADGDPARGLRFALAARHRDEPSAAASALTVAGTVRGEGAARRVDLEAALAPLALPTASLAAADGTIPALLNSLAGEVAGTVALSGTRDRLGVDASLETAAGPLEIEGVLAGRAPERGYDLTVSSPGVRLDGLVAWAPDSTRLAGRLRARAAGRAPDSVALTVEADVGASKVGALPVDSATVRLRIDDGLLRVDSLRVDAAGVRAVARRGSVGARSGVVGEGVRLEATAASIRRLRPLFGVSNPVVWEALSPIERETLIEFEGADPDTFPSARAVRFEGRARAAALLEGGLDDLRVAATLSADGAAVGLFEARSVALDVVGDGLGVLSLRDASDSAAAPRRGGAWEGRASADSVLVGERAFAAVDLRASFETGVGGRLHALVARSPTDAAAAPESYEAQGVVRLGSAGWASGRVHLDRLNFVFPDRRWGLRGPATLEWSPDAWTVRDFALVRPGAAGLRARAEGRLARGRGDTDFRLSISDLDLGVASRLLQTGRPAAGVAFVDANATGAPGERRWEGRIRVEGPAFADLASDRVVAQASYARQRASGRLESWTNGRASLAIEGSLPLDLALADVEARVPDGPIDLLATADSLSARTALRPFAVLEDVNGAVHGRIRILGRRILGRPSDLRYDGRLELRDASALVGALGVRLSGANLRLDFDRDVTATVVGSAESGGTVAVQGALDASDLADVGFDLAFWPQGLRVVDRRDVEAAVSGDSIALTGSFRDPRIEGRLVVEGGTVFIEEFRRARQAIDFYDPDLFAAATARIGSESEATEREVRARSPFLRNLDVAIDMDVDGGWLRSRTMNVETEGQLSLNFDRRENRPILNGEIQVVRGTYNLGPRALRIADGSFRFVGTPGFDPGLDVAARTRLRTRDGQPLVVQADISGTLLSPRLSLSSDAEAAIGEADLINYLVLGRPASALLSEGGGVSLGGRNLLLGQVFNELGYLLALELDLDHLSVSQAEQGRASAAFGASSLQVEAGWYALDNVFLTGVYQRGFCADPTLPASSGGFRVEVGMPGDATLEGFLEGQCTRRRRRGLGADALDLAQIWGISLFREWGY